MIVVDLYILFNKWKTKSYNLWKRVYFKPVCVDVAMNLGGRRFGSQNNSPIVVHKKHPCFTSVECSIYTEY